MTNCVMIVSLRRGSEGDSISRGAPNEEGASRPQSAPPLEFTRDRNVKYREWERDAPGFTPGERHLQPSIDLPRSPNSLKLSAGSAPPSPRTASKEDAW